MNPTLSIFLLTLVANSLCLPQVHRINNVKFAGSLSSLLAKQNPKENFLISPLSLEMLFASVLNGAVGATKNQIKNAVFDATTDQQVRDYLRSLLAAAKKFAADDDGAQMNMATVLAVDGKFAVRKQFKNAIKAFPDATLMDEVNFGSNGPQIAGQVNGIVSDATHQRIKNLIDPRSLNSDTALLLVNALYLKAKFKTIFENTYDDTFFGLNDREYPVEFMTAVFPELPLYADADLSVVKIPFLRDEFSFYVALPSNWDSSIDINQIINQALKAKFQVEEVDVHLPKFTMEYTAPELKRTMQSLNVTDLFDEGRANLRGLLANPGQSIAASDLRQKAFIAVESGGIEAAAASSMMMIGRSSFGPDNEFHANRPFVFFITMTHELNGKKFESVVFAGQYVKP